MIDLFYFDCIIKTSLSEDSRDIRLLKLVTKPLNS